MVIITKIIPSLKLAKMSDGELSEYCGQRIASLVAAALQFPGLVPSTDQLEEEHELYDAALDKAGETGIPADTTAKNIARQVLENSLLLCAQNCSEIAAGNLAKYQLSGFGYKQKGQPVTALDAPQNLTFKNGPTDGSVYAKFKAVKGAKSYEVWVGTSNDPATWTKVTTNSSNPVLITDLNQLTRYYGRARAIGARNLKGTWTAVVEFKVI